jgi:hypothetical protein
MKPTAWYDPSNGVVSTDRDCPLFTPLGQVWPLCLKREWVGLTQKEAQEIHDTYLKRMGPQEFASMIEAKLKQKNGYAEEKNT